MLFSLITCTMNVLQIVEELESAWKYFSNLWKRVMTPNRISLDVTSVVFVYPSKKVTLKNIVTENNSK